MLSETAHFNLAVVFFTSLALIVSAVAGETEDAARAKTLQDVKSLLDNSDSYQAISFINSLGEPDSVAEIYSHLIMDFYWKEKNVPYVVTIARAGIQYCLAKSDEIKSSNPEQSSELKRMARVLSYNLSSFTWPGWDEKGIVITNSDIQIGLDAARLNLRLVRELGEDDLKISIAYWAIGAQLMAVQKYDEALEAFQSSKEYAHLAANQMNELLADGYIGVSNIISGNPEGNKILGDAIKALEKLGTEDSKFFVEQFNTALNVFIK